MGIGDWCFAFDLTEQAAAWLRAGAGWARAGQPDGGWQWQGRGKAHRWWMKELRQVKMRRGTMAQRVMKLSNMDCR